MKEYDKLKICMILIILSILYYPFETKAKSFFWKAESDSGTVYMLGSIHLGKESFYPLDSAIEQGYDKSDYLVVELNINNINPAEVMKYMYFQDSSTLKSSVNEKTYNILKNKFDEMAIPEAYYGKLKPWAAAITLQQIELMKSDMSAELGIDQYFLEKAKDKKEILEIEKPEEQIRIFDSIEIKDINVFIEYLMKDLDSSAAEMDFLFKAWKNGDISVYEKYLNDEIEKSPEMKPFFKMIDDNRNVKMAEKIEGYLKTGKTYFVVVGAMHYVGTTGIIELLKKSGKYRIEKM